jgi:protein-L-isoaspartate(D-aspartate) O-methyltransferase
MESEARLRETLVARLERAGALRSRAVAGAMRRVPRHRFLPGISPDEAYADQAIALKSSDGEILSSISQPSMIARMLELLVPEPGQRILEIGTGSGYHAALLAELAGPQGAVTSVELDEEMSRRAAGVLADLGYTNVDVRTADGTAPVRGAPYDRVVVTARCEDVAQSWWDATREGGRLVIPLWLPAAGEFAIGFERRGDRLHGIGVHPCAFIALRGEGAGTGEERVFYNGVPQGRPHARPIRSIEAVRARDATPQLLEEADAVVARPFTMFGIRFG